MRRASILCCFLSAMACGSEPTPPVVGQLELTTVHAASLQPPLPAFDVWAAAADGSFARVEADLVEGEASAPPDLVATVDGVLRVRATDAGQAASEPARVELSLTTDDDPQVLIFHPVRTGSAWTLGATLFDQKTESVDPDDPLKVRLHLAMAGTSEVFAVTGYRLGTRTDLAMPRSCLGPFPTAELQIVDVLPGSTTFTLHAAGDSTCATVLGASQTRTVRAKEGWLVVGYGALEDDVALRLVQVLE